MNSLIEELQAGKLATIVVQLAPSPCGLALLPVCTLLCVDDLQHSLPPVDEWARISEKEIESAVSRALKRDLDKQFIARAIRACLGESAIYVWISEAILMLTGTAIYRKGPKCEEEAARIVTRKDLALYAHISSRPKALSPSSASTLDRLNLTAGVVALSWHIGPSGFTLHPCTNGGSHRWSEEDGGERVRCEECGTSAFIEVRSGMEIYRKEKE